MINDLEADEKGGQKKIHKIFNVSGKGDELSKHIYLLRR